MSPPIRFRMYYKDDTVVQGMLNTDFVKALESLSVVKHQKKKLDEERGARSVVRKISIC